MPARPLPDYLVRRFQGWRATTYAENRAWYRRLAEDGQRPRAMIVACCDSRVHVASLFGEDLGDFFIHRNIANLVPPYAPDGDHHGTSAAVEYAVRHLRVAHLVVLGHSGCGGVEACLRMAAGQAPDLLASTSFIGRWMDILRPACDALPPADDPARLRLLERAAVTVSLGNLLTFPFVREAVDDDRLTLHGLWNDIAEGTLDAWDPGRGEFVAV